MLCVCLFICSCDNGALAPSDVSNPEKQTGYLYKENGIMQSTLVYVEIPEQSMEEPLQKIYYKIRNDSDYDIFMKRQHNYRMDVYRDGAWREVAYISDGLILEGMDQPARLQAHGESGNVPMRFVDPKAEGVEGFPELGVGLYRMRIPYTFADLEGEVGQMTMEMVCYFNVSAAT